MGNKSRLFLHLYKMRIKRLICCVAIFSSIGCSIDNHPANAVQTDLLKKYKVQDNSDRQIVYIEEIAKNQLLVLDILRSYIGVEPMDYTRIRIFESNNSSPAPVILFAKDEMDGVALKKSRCLPKQYKIKYADKYYTKNENQEIIFAEWPYASGFGVVNVVKNENREYYLAFSENTEIDWMDLDNDKKPEIVTYDAIEIAWQGRVFEQPFILENAYQYNGNSHKYELSPVLSNKWVQMRLDKTLKTYYTQADAGSFQRIIRYYLKMNQKNQARVFFDRELNKILKNAKTNLSAADVSVLRNQISE